MKTLRLLLLVLTVGILATSCSKDDEYQMVSGNTYKTSFVKINAMGMSIEAKTIAEIEEMGMDMTWEFKTDGKFFVDGEEDGTWSQNEEEVTVISDGETLNVKAESDKLVLKESEEEMGITSEVEMHFTKK